MARFHCWTDFLGSGVAGLRVSPGWKACPLLACSRSFGGGLREAGVGAFNVPS